MQYASTTSYTHDYIKKFSPKMESSLQSPVIASLSNSFVTQMLTNDSSSFRIQNGLRAPSQRVPTSRTFVNTTILLKKGGKAAKQAERSSAAEEKPEDDPHDFSTLEAGIDKVLDKLQNDLSKLRTGGRFNPELLEGLKVKVGKDSNNTVVQLGALAQVVPKGGRSIAVLVGEADVSRMSQDQNTLN